MQQGVSGAKGVSLLDAFRALVLCGTAVDGVALRGPSAPAPQALRPIPHGVGVIPDWHFSRRCRPAYRGVPTCSYSHSAACMQALLHIIVSTFGWEAACCHGASFSMFQEAMAALKWRLCKLEEQDAYGAPQPADGRCAPALPLLAAWPPTPYRRITMD